MKRKVPSPRSSVKQRQDGNSKPVHSVPIAKAKLKNTSKGKEGKNDVLRIATPTSSKFEYLQSAGLIAPDEVASVEDAVPLDFTRLHGRHLGAVHSRYAVRHSHAIFVLAKIQGRLIALRRNLRIEDAKFTVRHRSEYKTKHEMDAAKEIGKGMTRKRKKVAELEAQEIVIDAIARGYEDLVRAASREMSRRSAENAPRD